MTTWPMSLGGSAPVIENGLVWLRGNYLSNTPGTLMALDEVTGKLKSSTTEACVGGEGTLTIAQKRIFVPSNCGVLTYIARWFVRPPSIVAVNAMIERAEKIAHGRVPLKSPGSPGLGTDAAPRRPPTRSGTGNVTYCHVRIGDRRRSSWRAA